MKVTLSVINRIMKAIAKIENLDLDSLEYYNDIEGETRYIVRAYNPIDEKTLFVYITKPCDKYEYDYRFVDGDKPTDY